MPPRHAPVEASGLKIPGEQQQLERVGERYVGKLGRQGPGLHDVPTFKRTSELRIHTRVARHDEHMFA